MKLNWHRDLAESFSSHQVQGAGALDLSGDLAVLLGGDASSAPRIDLTGLGSEFAEILGVEVTHLLRRNVVTTARHLAVGAPQVHGSFFVLGAHGVFLRDSN